MCLQHSPTPTLTPLLTEWYHGHLCDALLYPLDNVVLALCQEHAAARPHLTKRTKRSQRGGETGESGKYKEDDEIKEGRLVRVGNTPPQCNPPLPSPYPFPVIPLRSRAFHSTKPLPGPRTSLGTLFPVALSTTVDFSICGVACMNQKAYMTNNAPVLD